MKYILPTLIASAVSFNCYAASCDIPQGSDTSSMVTQAPYVASLTDFTVSGSDVVSITTGNYTLKVKRAMFKLSLLNSDGSTLLAEHPSRGVHFRDSNGGTMTSTLCSSDPSQGYVHFVVTNEHNQSADVLFWPREHAVRISVLPRSTDNSRDNDIAVLFSDLGDEAVFGLGDQGKDGNLNGKSNIKVAGNGHHDRFISTFAIQPEKGLAFAQMLQGNERLNRDSWQVMDLIPGKLKLAGIDVRSVKNSYLFIGDPKQIYREFNEAKKEAGYPTAKPDIRAFGAGWEAWPNLRYDTNQSAVQSNIQEFLDHGYPLKWGVVGSGFWEEGGTTTTFNRWNYSKYPNPQGMIDWFHERGLAIMFGLRPNFSMEDPESTEAIDGGFAAKDASGDAMIFASWEFPKNQPMVMLDGFSPEALQWWKEKTALWGVDGWKEDTMISSTSAVPEAQKTPYHDGFANGPMKILHDRGDIVMARNAYMANPGSIHRINDTGGEQLRIPQLVLSYAFSGSPNVYTDGIGNDSAEADYLVRHTLLSSMTATMAFGKKPWLKSEEQSKAMLRATKWHQAYLPTIYDAAIDAFDSGFPYTATPMPLAFPGDNKVYDLDDKKMWQWMIGESMLAHPVFGSGGYTRDVYLPEGIWIDYDSGEKFDVGAEGMTLSNYDHSMGRMPVFVGGKGVLIRQNSDENQYYAQVWPVKATNEAVTAEFTHTDGETRYQIVNQTSGDLSNATVIDNTTGQTVSTWFDNWGGSKKLMFTIQPGHKYTVSN